MAEILYLYSVKINGGGGPQILSCKDSELIAEKVFSLHIDGSNHLLSSLNTPNNFLRPFPGRGVRLICAVLIDTVNSNRGPVHLFIDEQVDIVPFLHYYNFRWIRHQKDIITSHPITYMVLYFTNEIRPKSSCKDRGGRGSAALSLHCKSSVKFWCRPLERSYFLFTRKHGKLDYFLVCSVGVRQKFLFF